MAETTLGRRLFPPRENRYWGKSGLYYSIPMTYSYYKYYRLIPK